MKELEGETDKLKKLLAEAHIDIHVHEYIFEVDR